MTTYAEIYDLFLSKISDYDLLEEYAVAPDNAEDELFGYLKSAIPKFTYSVKDLTDRDDTLKQFNINLIPMEQEILSKWMLVEYLSPKIFKTELLETNLGSKDFRLFSPANQIKEIRELKIYLEKEVNLLMVEYYYRQGVQV